MRMGHFFPYLAVALSVFGGYQAQAQDGGKEITVDYSNPKQYVVGGISVEGNKYINSDQILKISGLQPGFEVTVPGEEFSAVVDRLWLQKYFEDIFISEEIGFNKPDIRYFESCFSRIPSFSRETSVIVGDSLTSDIQGGINAGIRTVWFHPEREASGTAGEEEAVRPDREIRKLMELPELLRNWDSAGRQ